MAILRSSVDTLPGPGTYLDMGQDSAFTTASKAREESLIHLKRLRKGRVTLNN